MICVGHSQMVCVLQAAHHVGTPYRAIVLKTPKRGDQIRMLDRSNLIVDAGVPDFASETKALFAGTEEPIFSFIGGIKHVSAALRAVRTGEEAPFDFVLAEEPRLPLEEAADLLPYDAVRETLLRITEPFHLLLEKVARVTRAPVYQIESPPPPPDDWMRRWAAPRQERNRVGPQLLDLPVPFLTYKLWRLNSQLVREHAGKIAVTFVEHPREAVDAHGFLREELVRNYTHANEDYGALVVDQLRALQ